MENIDKLIESIKKGEQVLQNAQGNRSYSIVYLADAFFLETYIFNKETNENDLHRVECIDEPTARFALTARY